VLPWPILLAAAGVGAWILFGPASPIMAPLNVPQTPPAPAPSPIATTPSPDPVPPFVSGFGADGTPMSSFGGLVNPQTGLVNPQPGQTPAQGSAPLPVPPSAFWGS